MIMLSYLQVNAGITFIIIATSVDVPKQTPELVHGTFNNTMACLYNACLMPETNGFDPVCLATAPKRAKRAKEPQVKPSTTTQTKTSEVGKSPESSSSDCNFQDFENLESLNRNRSNFRKVPTTGLLVQSVNQVSYLEPRYFSNGLNKWQSAQLLLTVC